jgi:hypothetical protein
MNLQETLSKLDEIHAQQDQIEDARAAVAVAIDALSKRLEALEQLHAAAQSSGWGRA